MEFPRNMTLFWARDLFSDRNLSYDRLQLTFFFFQLCEKNELHFRRLVIRSFMFWTMVKLSRLLLDMDHFTDLKKEGDIMRYEFWLAVLEHSKIPLGIELKEKVQNSGIPYEKFCRSIVKIFSKSKDYCCFSRKDIHITPDDMLI